MKSPFRSIRQTLFNEGKLLRYLGYAIGEIALIIIGIMIALQLNNWNEDRKAQEEFELYIVQLKVDVRKSNENLEESIIAAERFRDRMAFTLSFLQLSEYTAEDLDAFENGLSQFGNYSEAQVSVGLLGDLLSGNTETIGRDRNLAQKALEMESEVELWLNNMQHLYNQIDLAANSINQFRGKHNSALGLTTIYDLEQLKSSREFRYLAQSNINRMGNIMSFSGRINEALESFLTVLEEYE